MKNIIKITFLSFLLIAMSQPLAAQRSRTLQKDTKFKQIGTGNTFILFKSGTKVVLTSKNEAMEGTLAVDTKIARPGWDNNAVLFKAGTKILFHSDGSPKNGTLAANTKFIRYGTMNDRSTFLAGTEIELDKSSLAKKGTLAAEEILTAESGKKLKFKKGNKVTFNSNGLVKGY